MFRRIEEILAQGTGQPIVIWPPVDADMIWPATGIAAGVPPDPLYVFDYLKRWARARRRARAQINGPFDLQVAS